MIKSMTGFGRSELKCAQGMIRVEIKTTNHKFLEISSRVPSHLGGIEESIRKQVSQGVRRGKIYLNVQCPDPSAFSTHLVLNEGLAREVSQKIHRLRQVLGLKGAPKDSPAEQGMVLREVLHYPDVLRKDVASAEQSFFKELTKAVSMALEHLKKSRVLEGRALEKDFLLRMRQIHAALSIIEKRIPTLHREYKKSLENRMKELLKDGKIDQERLTIEVAQYVKNSDVSEEVTRLKSHLDAMKRALAESGEMGRKLDFIGQEMIREANTIGSKSNDVVIANQVIQIKSAIEKIREQSQNVE